MRRYEMNHISNSRPPLPNWMFKAYNIIYGEVEPLSEANECPSITQDRALHVLLKDEDLALEPDEAHYALSRLVERGYLYQVNDNFRVTTPQQDPNDGFH